MGKTKTAVVSGMPDTEKSGKEAYEEKRKRKDVEAKKSAAAKAGADKKAQVGKVGLKGGERIKVVTGEPAVTDEPKQEPASLKVPKPPKARGKKYKIARKKIDNNKLYKLPEALKLVKDTSFAKFDGTVEMHLVTKRDGISQNVKLPYSTGKKKRVEIADAETLKKLKKGKVDFDILLATPEMMPKLVPFAKLLGPRGLMPNPKSGTLIKDKAQAKKFEGNTIQIKTEKDQPVIHTIIGKVSQKKAELEENAKAIIDALGAKQITKAYLTSTMSPSVKLEI